MVPDHSVFFVLFDRSSQDNKNERVLHVVFLHGHVRVSDTRWISTPQKMFFVIPGYAAPSGAESHIDGLNAAEGAEAGTWESHVRHGMKRTKNK